ncbi:unnamed protein product, partial [Musa acuminata subsp. burmannicoides]
RETTVRERGRGIKAHRLFLASLPRQRPWHRPLRSPLDGARLLVPRHWGTIWDWKEEIGMACSLFRKKCGS